MIIKILIVFLYVIGFLYLIYQIMNFWKQRKNLENYSYLKTILIGIPTGFLDVFGIGSFATSTLLLRKTHQVDDKYLPGVLNVSFAIPGIIEAIVFIDNVAVDSLTLIVLTISGILGAFICSKFLCKLSRTKVRYALGIALCISALFIFINQINLIQIQGDQFILTGGKLIIGGVGMFLIGAGMCIGIGMFAPGMALLYILGMSPRAVLPILMGCCAFVMATCGFNFMKKKAYEVKNSTGLTIGYTIGVLIASFIAISIDVKILKWIVIFAILYASISLIRSAKKERND